MYFAYRKLESIAAKKSAAMSTLTDAVIPILESRNGKIPALRTVVPTSVDLNRFALSRIMPEKIKVLFSGTYNEYYDLDLSAQFIKEFQKSINCEIHWARPTESSRSTIEVGENRVFLSSQIGMSTTIPLYSFGVSVCKIDAGPSLSAAMPTKIAEFLACGRPIVVNKGLGDMDRFINEFDAGVVLDGTASNLVESAEKMVSLLSDTDTPLRCRALAEKYFSMDVGAKKYLELYSQVLIR
jgi:glycosyltransferase involved in cell wall biosynthesis